MKECLEEILGSLDKQHDWKRELSKDFLPQVSISMKRECIKNFQQVTSDAHLPIRMCAVCSQLTSDMESKLVDEMDTLLRRIADASGALVVDECRRVESQYRVCNPCHKSLSNKILPKYAILNNFDVGCNHGMPDYLKNLTEVEEMLIAKSRPFGKVRKLGKKVNSSINYRQIDGHVIVVPEKVSTVYTILPSQFLSLSEVIKVI